jgi:hypothetical protein
MFFARSRTNLAGALASMAVAATIAAPVAYALPADPVGSRGSVPEVAPPPSSIAMSAGDSYEELRSPGGSTSVASQAVEPSVPGGFDWVSAAIGAVAAAGLSLVAMAALGMRRQTGRRAASA